MTRPTVLSRHTSRLIRAAVLVLVQASTGSAQAPVVDRIEPASWWTGMKWDTVQLLVYGADLDGVEARFVAEEEGALPRPRVVEVRPAASPAHAFIRVHLPDGMSPGAYTLELRRNGEATRVTYPVLDRAPREGRYRGFGPEDVVYLVMPDRFANGLPVNDRVAGFPDEHDRTRPGGRHGGDLQGIIQRLDYLADLGVTALWLNPVLENRGRGSYHGYAATNLYRVDPRLGSNEDYRRLVEEAHRRGMKVIFDHIANHIGVQHPWVGTLPTDTWLHGTVQDHLRERHYMMAPADPYAPPHIVEQLKSFWFVDAMPDLNQRDPLLAEYLIQNTLWWIEYTGLDGIREDTYPYPDQAFLADWAEAILDEYPDFNIVGEIWNGNPAYTALYQKDSPLPRDFETNLPTVMDFALSDAWRAYLAGTGTLEGVYQVLAQDFLYADPDYVMTFVDNHDMPRAMFVADGNTMKVKQGLAMLLTTRGIPQILYGTEIGMMGGQSHVELRADMPGGWPGDDRSAFSAPGRTPEEADVFDYLRRLLHLRQQHPALTGGDLIHFPPTWNNNTYTYLRRTDEETILVMVNGYPDGRTVSVEGLAPLLPAGARLLDLMTGESLALDPSGVAVPGWGVRILEVDPGR